MLVFSPMSHAKAAAGKAALPYIKSGMTVGLGTGSTAHYFVEALGEAVQQGLEVQALATSRATAAQAQRLGIPLLSIEQVGILDVTVDGADEIDPYLNLIKGGGGALYREKLVASLSRELIIIADKSKQVPVLGKFPLPVEVIPFGMEITRLRLNALGFNSQLRRDAEGNPFYTDNGNLILDCQIGDIHHPKALHRELKIHIGVVDTGLFLGMASRAIIGYEDGRVQEIFAQTEEE
jgi:ribose 5-phosphate isomerase A